MGVYRDDPEKREEMLLGGLGALQGREGGRDYIVCCRAYTTVAAAAGSIGIIGIGASIFLLFIIYLCAFICPI